MRLSWPPNNRLFASAPSECDEGSLAQGHGRGNHYDCDSDCILHQQVNELTKREARLKDVFQKQVTNFREAVYLLFGYRVDMAAEASSSKSTKSQAASFVLRPQHPDSSRAQLVFKFKGRLHGACTHRVHHEAPQAGG